MSRKCSQFHYETSGCLTVGTKLLPVSSFNAGVIYNNPSLEVSVSKSTVITTIIKSNTKISTGIVCKVTTGGYILYSSDAYLLTIDGEYLIPVKDE